MKRIIVFVIAIIAITVALSATVYSVVIDGQNYNQRIEVANVSTGFGSYWGVAAPNQTDASHTANLLREFVPIATHGDWFNTTLGLARTRQFGLQGTVNGANRSATWATLWQAQNQRDMVSFSGTISSPYRGFNGSINRTVVPLSWTQGQTTAKIVGFWALPRNHIGVTVSGLDAADEAGVVTRVTGTGLPTHGAYGTSRTFSLTGGARVSRSDIDFGTYSINITIPNADRYRINYSVWYRPGSKFANQGNDFDITYFTGTGANGTIAIPARYMESGGEISVTIGASLRGTVIVDLRRSALVTESLGGRQFELLNPNGTIAGTATTDANGFAYFYDIRYGSYTIRPPAAPAGHFYTPNSVPINLNATSVTGVVTLMREVGNLTIRLNTEDNLSRQGAQFRVTDPHGVATIHTTNVNGNISLVNTDAGTYSIEQVSANADYERVTEAQTVTLTHAGILTVTFYNPILYDFSVELSAPASTRIGQSFTLTATFRNKGGKAGNNVPVNVTFDGQTLLTGTINIPANSAVTRTFTVTSNNAGARTISVTVNISQALRENFMTDNSVSRTINVTGNTTLGIEFITPNAAYREGTEVISTFRVSNEGGTDIIPSSNLSVSLAVTYTQGGVNRSVTVPVRNQVVIPADGNNLVFFRWAVPDGTAGIQFRLTATVDPDNRINVTNRNNHVITVNRTIIAANTSTTPDTQFEARAPSGFSRESIPTRPSATSNSWAIWEWENNAFVRRIYGLELNPLTLRITPDVNSPSRSQSNGVWTMRSGYGFLVDWATPTRTLAGTITPSSTAFTNVQVASIFFPEFRYSNVMGRYRHLDRNGTNNFRLPVNPNATNNARLHFVPLWMPDGDYQCQGFISDVWTPAGMLYGYHSSSIITISGSAYDDWTIRN